MKLWSEPEFSNFRLSILNTLWRWVSLNILQNLLVSSYPVRKHTTAYIDCLNLSTQTRQHLLQVRQTSEKVWRQRGISGYISTNSNTKEVAVWQYPTVPISIHQISVLTTATSTIQRSQTTALLTDSSKLYRKSCKIMPDITCHANSGTFKNL